MATSGTGRGDDSIPKWAEALITSQTQLTKQLATLFNPCEPGDAAEKTRSKGSIAKPKKSSLPHDPEDDEFDQRFGHLFTDSVEGHDDQEYEQDEEQDEEPEGEQDDEQVRDHKGDQGEVVKDMSIDSEDDDLIQVLDKTPNWKLGTRLHDFIAGCIDRPLPDDVHKNIADEYVPEEDKQQFFSAPKMPHRLYKAISRMSSKCSIKTERALYNSQKEIFIVVKPLLAALLELKPLGKQVSNARRLITMGVHGLYSISLKVSKARRDNVRFLFKEELAEVLYGYEPNHISLYGGSDFASQVEKATKVAKIDLSWSKKPNYSQPFRSRGSQGFRGSRGGGYNHYRGYKPNRQSYGRGASKTYGYKNNPKKGKGANKKPQE